MLKPTGSQRVYIAGPYTRGDTCLNVRAAVHAADVVLELGHLPFLPHLSHLWHLISPKDYETWLEIDLAWLNRCDCLVRIPGDSAGADREVAEAIRLGLPVYHGLEAFEGFVREMDHLALGGFNGKTCPGHDGKGPPCCDRAGEYNGFGSDGPTIFTCPRHCSCHD